MRTVAALEAKNRFGELLDTAQREPVTIEKHGRAVAVVVSAEEYKAMEALKLASLRAEIDKGLDDIAAGRTADGEEAFKALRERFGQWRYRGSSCRGRPWPTSTRLPISRSIDRAKSRPASISTPLRPA
jgi:prevent-host-death family protein